jgi:hypothetical protein
MDAICPEIRLSLAPGEAEVEARDWRYEHSGGMDLMLHVPTRALFHLYPERRTLGGRRVIPRFDKSDMRARLVHVCDGFPMPQPDEITALGRAAILWFIDWNEIPF